MTITTVQFEQLKTAIEDSIKQLATPRANRINAIKEFVGIHYNDGGADKRVPTNYIELATNIYTRALAPRAPRVLATARNSQLKVAAKEMELALNQVPDEISLSQTLKELVVETIFGIGILKVGIHTVGQVLGHDYGGSFVDVVTLDDYFVDMSAEKYANIQFEGNDYWLNLDDIVRTYNVSKQEIVGDDNTVTNEDGQTRAKDVSVSNGMLSYKSRVKLRDVWLPEDNTVITYVVSTGKLLREISWDGPEHGPYYRLGFTEVPGNPLPLPPVALWQDLHDLANGLFRKLSRQADGQKRVLGFDGSDDQGVKEFKAASDGDGIKFLGKDPVELSCGGIDQGLLAFFLQTRDTFSYLAGNLDSLGGLAPMSDTVGQDKLLSEAASSRLKEMSERTIDLIRSVYRTLAWYEWTDPVRQRHISKDIPGTEVSIKSVWSRETREGDWLDYNFDIDVYSMQDDTPSDKLRKLGAIMTEYVMPLMPLLQQSGAVLNVDKLLSMVGEFANMPEISELITFSDTAMSIGNQPVRGNDQPAYKPAQTKRVYERVNRPGATRQGHDQVMSQLLVGGNPQKDEKMSLFRGVS